MKRTFEFEHSDDLGREWLNKDNMQWVCDRVSHDAKGNSLIKVVQEINLIKSKIMGKGTIDTLYLMLMVDSTIKKVTKYHAENRVTKLTKIGKPSKNERQIHLKLTVGKPNYAEREFIKKCKKAGEPFPVRQIQIKRYPKRKKS